jgi:hypothetical protein
LLEEVQRKQLILKLNKVVGVGKGSVQIVLKSKMAVNFNEILFLQSFYVRSHVSLLSDLLIRYEACRFTEWYHAALGREQFVTCVTSTATCYINYQYNSN